VSKPRFIAGAVCPHCHAVDRTVLVVSASQRMRRCIACGHEEVQATSPHLPRGRLDGAARNDDAPTKPLRILPAKPKRND